MGDIADMMLDGILCEGCGEFMGEAVGYPRRCPSCEEPEPGRKPRRKPKGKRNDPSDR